MLSNVNRSDRNNCRNTMRRPLRVWGGLEVVAGAVEVGEQLLALGPDGYERLHEPLLTGRLQPDDDRARVGVPGGAGHEAGRLGPVDELGDRALGQLEVVAQLPD